MIIKIFAHILLLLSSPERGWKRANEVRSNHEEFLNNFLYPIFGVISITTFAGAMWLSDVGGVHYALRVVIAAITSLFAGFHLASFMVNELFPKYGMVKDTHAAQQFVGYSSVMLYVLYLLMPLINGYRGLWTVALLSIYLTITGSKIFLGINEDKRIAFSFVSLLIIVLLPLILNYLLRFAVL